MDAATADRVRKTDLVLLDAETFRRVYTYIELTGIATKAILL